MRVEDDSDERTGIDVQQLFSAHCKSLGRDSTTFGRQKPGGHRNQIGGKVTLGGLERWFSPRGRELAFLLSCIGLVRPPSSADLKQNKGHRNHGAEIEVSSGLTISLSRYICTWPFHRANCRCQAIHTERFPVARFLRESPENRGFQRLKA
jgi:hypothetical protein